MTDDFINKVNLLEKFKDETQTYHEINTRRLDEISYTLKGQNDVLAEIKNRVTIQNGRTGALETWRSFITGGLTVITLIIVPLVIYIMNHLK